MVNETNAAASGTALYVVVGPRQAVRTVTAQMLHLRPPTEPWAVLCDEVGLLDQEALKAPSRAPTSGGSASDVLSVGGDAETTAPAFAGVQWRELFAGCSCCVAAASPVLRATIAQLMRSKPRPARFLLVLSQDAEPAARLLPLLGKYFGKFAPLHAVIACTDFSTHAALYHRDEEEEDDDGNDVAVRVGSGRGNQGAESVNAAKKVEGEAGDRGGSSGGASDMPVLAYREQFELADIVVWVDEGRGSSGLGVFGALTPGSAATAEDGSSLDSTSTSTSSSSSSSSCQVSRRSATALSFAGIPKRGVVCPGWHSHDLFDLLSWPPPLPPAQPSPTERTNVAPVVGGEPLPVTESGKQQKEGAVLAAVHEDQGIAPQAGRLRFTHVSSNAATTLPSVANPQPRPHTHPHPHPHPHPSSPGSSALPSASLTSPPPPPPPPPSVLHLTPTTNTPRPTAPRGAFQERSAYWSPCALAATAARKGGEGEGEASNLNNAPIITMVGYRSAVRAWYRPEPATDENETRYRRSSSWSAFEEVDGGGGVGDNTGEMSGDTAEPNARHDDGSRRTMEPRKKALQRILSTAWLLPPPPSPQTAGSGKNRAKTIASPYRFAPPTMEELARGVAEAALAAAAKFPGSSTPPPPPAAAAAAEVATLEVHVSMVLRSSRGGHQLVTARAKIPLSSCSLAPESSAPGASASNVDSDSGSSNSSSSSSDLGTGGEGVALGAAGEVEAEVTPCESNVTEGIMCSAGLPRRYIRQAGCGTWFEVSLAVGESAEMGEAGRTEARAAGRPFLTAAFREHWENSGIPAVEATLVAACACAAATTKGS